MDETGFIAVTVSELSIVSPDKDMIAIFDYGIGNIHSVRKALEKLGARTVLTCKEDELSAADKIVLPGVGAFDDAMESLERGGAALLKKQAACGKIILGICLGMQVLFCESEEASSHKGLGVLDGRVLKFRGGLKVPHMGWNRIKLGVSGRDCPLLRGIDDGEYVYFCHSYYASPREVPVSAGLTEYGTDFTSVAWKDNVFAVQFHPEKSQGAGLRILRNFIALN